MKALPNYVVTDMMQKVSDDLKAVVFRSARHFTDPTQASIICLGGAAEMLGAAARFMQHAHPGWSEKETRAALQAILLDMAEKAIVKGRTH